MKRVYSLKTQSQVKMRLFLFLLTLSITFPLVNAQNSAFRLLPHGNMGFNQNPNLDVGFSAGTSFSSFGRGFSMFSNHISPHFLYRVSPNFSLEIGTTFSKYNSGNVSLFPLSGNPLASSFTGVSGYVTGKYMQSDKLMIFGSVFRESSVLPVRSVNPAAFEFLNQGAMVGFEYKVNDRFSFGAEFQMSHTTNPWGGSSFQNRHFHRSPFYGPGRF